MKSCIQVHLLAIALATSLVFACDAFGRGREQGSLPRLTHKSIHAGAARIDVNQALDGFFEELGEVKRGLLMVASDETVSKALRGRALVRLTGILSHESMSWCLDHLSFKAPTSPPSGTRGIIVFPAQYLLESAGWGALGPIKHYLRAKRRTPAELGELAQAIAMGVRTGKESVLLLVRAVELEVQADPHESTPVFAGNVEALRRAIKGP